MARSNSRGNRGPFDVLFVESDPEAASRFVESFEATDATETVSVVGDGGDALDFLHQREGYADAPRPDIILLDLHVPGTSGNEILAELDSRPELRRIPVLVLTASEAAADVTRSYELNANAYLEKPTTSDAFVTMARAIEDFWLGVAHLPPK